MSPSWKSLMAYLRSSPPMTILICPKTNWLCKCQGKQLRKRKWNIPFITADASGAKRFNIPVRHLLIILLREPASHAAIAGKMQASWRKKLTKCLWLVE
ncbi:MreB/Mbl protein [Musa troglodytarum]|uniref:MreB/Mbl protein n=1 Tax=Musa troglodytarum TaxID=320322 RepID=A0A9E7K0Z6_9LILI|nr:MreB/Mbl protein [Musa troglodytarum]